MFGREWGLMTLEYTYLVVDDTADNPDLGNWYLFPVSQWFRGGEFVEFRRISNLPEFALDISL